MDETAGPTSAPGAETPPARAAVVDLAARLGVEREQVEVVAVEDVTWHDGSLGCARPGLLYTQALVEGSRITLSVAGTTYEYHAGRSGRPALCEHPTE